MREEHKRLGLCISPDESLLLRLLVRVCRISTK